MDIVVANVISSGEVELQLDKSWQEIFDAGFAVIKASYGDPSEDEEPGGDNEVGGATKVVIMTGYGHQFKLITGIAKVEANNIFVMELNGDENWYAENTDSTIFFHQNGSER